MVGRKFPHEGSKTNGRHCDDVMQIDRAAMFESAFDTNHNFTRYVANCRCNRRYRDRVKKPDHVLPSEDQYGPFVIGLGERKLPDLSARGSVLHRFARDGDFFFA